MKKLVTLASLGAAVMSTKSFSSPEFEIGAEYQINAIFSDDGLNKPQESKRSEMNLKGAKIAFRGKLSDQINMTVLYKAKERELERYWLTNKVSEDLDVSIGLQKIKVYGLHRKYSSSTTSPVVNSILSLNPLPDKVAVDISYKLAGMLSLQVLEDYSKCSDKTNLAVDPSSQKVVSTTTSSCTSWNTTGLQKQPAIAFEWLGSFGKLQPLFQYARYDLGKSVSTSLGVRYKNENIEAFLDATVDTRNNKGTGVAGNALNEKNVYKGLTFYSEYNGGLFSPFLQYSRLETEPYLAANVTESERIKLECNTAGRFDKVESSLAVGSFANHWGSFYRPFANVNIGQGCFVDKKDSQKEVVLTRAELTLGLIGKF